VVERLLAKEEVASSNLVFRSIVFDFPSWRCSQEVKAGVCKTPIQRFESARRLVLCSLSSSRVPVLNAEVAEW
jgi:hypothetical protein